MPVKVYCRYVLVYLQIMNEERKAAIRMDWCRVLAGGILVSIAGILMLSRERSWPPDSFFEGLSIIADVVPLLTGIYLIVSIVILRLKANK